MNTYLIRTEEIEYHLINAEHEGEAMFLLDEHLDKLWGKDEALRLMGTAKVMFTSKEGETGYKLTIYSDSTNGLVFAPKGKPNKKTDEVIRSMPAIEKFTHTLDVDIEEFTYHVSYYATNPGNVKILTIEQSGNDIEDFDTLPPNVYSVLVCECRNGFSREQVDGEKIEYKTTKE